jgi:hypothetical protein
VKWYIWLAIGLVLIGGGVAVAVLPRGIRNNNPGNIRDTDQTRALWLGEVEGGPNDDPAFLVFQTPEHGIRALARLLRNYQKDGLRTLSQIISRYAPGNENNTVAYVNAVASELVIDPAQDFNVDQRLPALLKAIIRHENGQQPYTDQQIQQGIAMA